MPRDTLTIKQEKFCLNYFKCGNATQAAIDAGYSPRTANEIAAENLAKPSIVNKMNYLKNKLNSKTVLDVTQRREKLSAIINKASTENVSTRDGLQAVDLLNKMDKLYSDAPVTINNTQVIFQIGKGYNDKIATSATKVIDADTE